MSETLPVSGITLPKIRRIDGDEPWRWLSKGWADLRRTPSVSLSYGLIVALIGWAMTAFIWVFEQFYLIMPMAAGFMLFGPIAAVGLYDISRRLDAIVLDAMNQVQHHLTELWTRMAHPSRTNTWLSAVTSANRT